MKTLGLILLSGVLAVTGQFILKLGMASVGPMTLGVDTLATVVPAVVNPLVVLGLLVYVSGTFFWLLVLSRVDLSYAYPFASLNYIVVLLGSWLLLGEQVSLVRMVGVLSICLGVWAISRTPNRTAAPAGPRGSVR